jgi:hypothetical protein
MPVLDKNAILVGLNQELGLRGSDVGVRRRGDAAVRLGQRAPPIARGVAQAARSAAGTA